jgi:peptidyl-tRNA hydrolase, PTH1 family
MAGKPDTPLILCFLGNPESRYLSTRHNAGWMTVEHLTFRHELSWREKFKGRLAEYRSGERKIVLLMPLTWMNVSGESLAPAAAFYKMPAARVAVVHDDLELRFGTIGIRRGGGLGGHNGLRSVKASLGTAEFIRVRIGIGRPERGSVSSWVLSRFNKDEEAVLQRVLDATADLIETRLVRSEITEPAVLQVLPEG